MPIGQQRIELSRRWRHPEDIVTGPQQRRMACMLVHPRGNHAFGFCKRLRADFDDV